MGCSCFPSVIFFYWDYVTFCCMKSFCRMSLFSSVVVPRASLEGRGEVTVAHVLYQVAGSSAGLGAFSCLSSVPPGNYSYSLWDPRAVLDCRQSPVLNMDCGVLSWFSVVGHEKPLENKTKICTNMKCS